MFYPYCYISKKWNIVAHKSFPFFFWFARTMTVSNFVQVVGVQVLTFEIGFLTIHQARSHETDRRLLFSWVSENTGIYNNNVLENVNSKKMMQFIKLSGNMQTASYRSRTEPCVIFTY